MCASCAGPGRKPGWSPAGCCPRRRGGAARLAGAVRGWAAFAVAGCLTGRHTARRTSLALDGPSTMAGARAGWAISLALMGGAAVGVWAATHGVPGPDATRLGLGAAASAAGAASLGWPWASRATTAATSALCWAVALVWWLVPHPGVGAALLVVALGVAGLRAGRR